MKTVVIIDDEFGLADVLSEILADMGYRVYSAMNGVQGLELMAEHAPDVVLLDFMMPLLDGPGVLRAMKTDPRFRDVPVIMMSAVSERAVATRADGYVAFLRKPFDFDAVSAAVAKVVGLPDVR